MLIQCPGCRARAKLPDDKEGAKVRCSECGRVYVARAPGSKGRSSGPSTGLLIGGFVGALGLIALVFIVKSSGGSEPVTEAGPAVDAEPVETPEYGWKSPLVQDVVKIHAAAAARDLERLKTWLHGPRIWQREREEGAEQTVAVFAELPAHERLDAMERWAQSMVEGEGKELVADWQPYDGMVVEQGDLEAVVRVAVKPRDGGIENRWIEWRLADEKGRLKAWKWERWLSPDEVKAASRKKGYDVVTLSDGSVVHERQPEPLEHLEDTPPEVRARIDSLIATMLDLDLTKEASRARRELVEIGKPAIPRLLTTLYETPADTEENRIRCNIVDQALRSITGESFGYAPGDAGTAAGTTEERRQSSIKQWFAWWYKKGQGKRFESKREEDALEGLIELDAKEKAWLERNQD